MEGERRDLPQFTFMQMLSRADFYTRAQASPRFGILRLIKRDGLLPPVLRLIFFWILRIFFFQNKIHIFC